MMYCKTSSLLKGYTVKELNQEYLTGERVLFKSRDLKICNTVFDDGESPLKECENIELYNSLFKWKYPIWYCKHMHLNDCYLFPNARAGIWYTDDICIKNTVIDAPKTVRRCDGVSMENVTFSSAVETLWHCKNIRLNNITAKGEYFGMNSEDMEIDGLTLVGQYSFDGVKNVTIRNSKLMTKDAFWNSENVTVCDSIITGEYLGWNAKNLTFINCTVESLQGMCYIDNITMKNCRLLNTTLAFEYSSVDADIVGKIDSVFNPSSGRITADKIDELTVDRDAVDPDKTVIICRNQAKV